MTGTTTSEVNWLLDELTARTPTIRHAVILSTDGLAIASSRGLNREDREHLAAVSSGFNSLAKGATRQFGAGAVRQSMVEFEDGFLFVVAAGAGACLAVFANADSDIGLVAYEMARLVKQVGEHLFVPIREDFAPDGRPQAP
ncbi:roadblock/LC7 domain-containing protein [Actinospica durhamensis]|uniref:roadblock/LC7 domain-containing protein n=1 Tax=Actinospica durhamensis TaxID=1508375 RepID=UPI0027DC3855|nr:roadblock/LC7 domain-containing protein [Actinospica durhamensis]